MERVLRKTDDHYTYGDYRTWPSEDRWELINGVAWNMSPAPSRAHQALLGELFPRFHGWLTGKPCQVYLAPFDVILPADTDQASDEADTVVQPDLSVFCDPARLTEAGARGAPDLVVEILSPWTSKKTSTTSFPCTNDTASGSTGLSTPPISSPHSPTEFNRTAASADVLLQGTLDGIPERFQGVVLDDMS